MRHLQQAVIVGFWSATVLLSTEGAMADAKTGDGSSAIKKAQGLIRQLSQEKSALEAEKSVWRQEKEQLETRLHALEQDGDKQRQSLQGEVGRYKTELESMKAGQEIRFEQERRQKQELLQKHNEMVVKAKAIFADNQLLVQTVRERELWMAGCADNNRKLRQINAELLERYQKKSWVQMLKEMEPLTGIASVETEMAADALQYRLDQLQITPYKDQQVIGQNATPDDDGKREQEQ